MGNVVNSLKELIKARQHNRILRLSFPYNDGPRCEFVVETLDAFESLSRDFEFTVEILSDNADIALKDIQGKLFSVELVQKGGTLRYFSGYCFSFRLKKVENLAFYEAKLGPWLKYLSLRRNSFLFYDASLRQQTASIFKDYSTHAVWDFKVYGDDAPMTVACQFDETDSNYLHRHWEAVGIYYHYEHDGKGHKLVLADDSVRAKPIDGDPAIRFHVHGGAQEEDAIGEWSPVRCIEPSSVTLRAFNFKGPRPHEINLPTLNQQGGVLSVESYEYAGAYGLKTSAAGDRLVRLRLEEMEAAGKHFEAAGNNSRVMPGRWFSLVDRFGKYPFGNRDATGVNAFLILEVRHSVTNNYLQKPGEEPHYDNRFTCMRKAIPWRPGRGFNSVDTRILAPQTATVVGPKGVTGIHTDEYGRIRVRFHWDRLAEDNKPGSAWIRVSSSWAGAELGAAAVPRIGSEVIVQWLDGNPDRPIVTGSVFNSWNMPPWRLATQQALSGLRSRELVPGAENREHGRSNHLILDDSYQKIQAQLKSDHEQSQLSLGYITRIEANSGRKHAGGEGWELATNAWGVARAARGMLLTTEAIASATPEAKDMGGGLQRLASAQDQHATLAGMAENAKAQEAGQQAAIADALARQNQAIRGGAGDFPELSEPQLVLASPAGIAVSSASTVHVASTATVAITGGKSVSIAAGELFVSVANTFRLFVHKAGMKLIAASGKVEIQAQRDDLEVLANKVLTLISETDWVDIKGKKGVRLHGANCMIEVGEQIQVFTSSPTLFHGNLQTLAPKPVSQHFNERPASRFDQEVRFLGPDNKPAKDIEHEIHREDGNVIDGKTAASGTTGVQKSAGMDSYTIRYKGELP
ncbi:MAG: Rhs element Vgr protein [Massilia sp.]|jgi:type VI secretion system secreted protein VgrG|nr:Rhs element Vgr protein [Massilia sp.]